MNCPRCHSEDVRRRRRKTLLDQAAASLGRWPYLCEACGNRFRAVGRTPAFSQQKPSPAATEAQRPANAGAPEMAFRRDPIRPLAKVVIQADSHEQLNGILLALGRELERTDNLSRMRAKASAYAQTAGSGRR